MRVWVKLLAGSLLGLLLGFLLPTENPAFSSILATCSNIALHMGRYTAVALIVFSLVIGIYELRQDGAFWPLIFRSFALIAVVSTVVIALGMFVAVVFPPDRIPILAEQSTEKVVFDTRQYILEMFPSNMLSVIGGEGLYLFPLCIFAFFLGIGLSYDKSYTKPVITLIDSLSRIFYHIAAFFSEILGLLIIALAAYWAIRYHSIMQVEVFTSIIRLLLVFSLVLAFVIMPLFLYALKKYKTPWKVAYASLGSAFSSFFSGDINFCLPLLIQQSKENLGIRRRANSLIAMLWTTFGRSGSAVVAAISMLVIIKSYSSLGIPSEHLAGIALQTLLISFLLARNPGDGVFAALAVLCLGYGHGFENGYLILKPIAFYLISIGTFLDIMIASFGCFALSRLCGFQTERETKNFI